MDKACWMHTREAKGYEVTVIKLKAMGKTWHKWDVTLKQIKDRWGWTGTIWHRKGTRGAFLRTW